MYFSTTRGRRASRQRPWLRLNAQPVYIRMAEHRHHTHTRKRNHERIFRAFDRGLSGSVDYHEFCDFLLHGAVLGGKHKASFKRHHHRRPHTTNGGDGYGFLSSGRKRARRKGHRHHRSAGSDSGSCFGAFSGDWGSSSRGDSYGSTSSCSRSSEDDGRNGECRPTPTPISRTFFHRLCKLLVCLKLKSSSILRVVLFPVFPENIPQAEIPSLRFRSSLQ